MKTNPVSERGQVLVLIALAIIGLVGITGLAIDGSMILADRRHAQNAADTAALAGALERIQSLEEAMSDADSRASMRVVAWDIAELNGYLQPSPESSVEVYLCDEIADGANCPAPYTGDGNYVQVIITSHVNTFFAQVLGIEQLHNRVQAIALADDDDSGPLGNGSSITSYAKECQSPDNFTVSGTTQVIVNGGSGLFINTSNPACGFKCTTEGALIDANITSAGGTIGLDNSCEDNYTDTTATDGEQLDFPITVEDIGLDVPPECDAPIGSYSNYEATDTLPPSVAGYDYPGKGIEKVTVLHPGRYGQFPPPKDSPALKLNDVMLMEPGMYCVSDVIRWNQDKFVLVGEEVTIYIRAGYDFQFSDGVVDITAPTEGDYAGYLIIVEPDYGVPELSENPEACIINGDGLNNFTGSIFAPYCNCTLNGSGDSYGFNAQLLCHTVNISGGGIVTFTYDPGVLAYKDDPAKTGVVK